MIYLQPEFISTLQDDTFWMWFHRTFRASYDVPDKLRPDDFILQYGMLGPPRCTGGTRIALLWELYPEMAKQLGGYENAHKIAAMKRCHEECDLSLVTAESMLEFFPGARVMPIGVDTDLFSPGPVERSGVFWCGTEHPMKGLDLARQWQDRTGSPVTYIMKGDQKQIDLAETMQKHEYVLLTGRLRPLFLVEWEALASGLKPIDASPVPRDPMPTGDPRQFVLDQGWSRSQVALQWREILGV